LKFRALLIAAIAAAVSGCAVELRVGCGPRQVIQPGSSQIEGACELVLTQRFGEHVYCSAGHTSEPQDGRGGDPREADVSITQGTCGLLFGGRQ